MERRGSRFFVEFTNLEADKKTGGKGRSGDLLKVRNEKLLYRFYYHSRILTYKYERVLFELSNEFDLSECTIMQLIEKNTERIREIGDEQPTRERLKKKYPFFSWGGTPALMNKDVKEREVFILK